MRRRRSPSVSKSCFEGLALSPTFIVGTLDAGARLGHNLGDGVAPCLVVGCLLVLRWVVGATVNFDQHKAGWVIQLLDHIKVSHPILVSRGLVFSLACDLMAITDTQ